MKKVKACLAAAILLSLFFTLGCGPTDTQVMESIDIANKKFESIPIFQDSVGRKLAEYGSAELSFENDDETIRQDVNYSLEEKALIVEGACIFSDYFDNTSGCTLNGKISFDMEGNLKNQNDFYLQFTYDINFDSGKIRTIQFSLNSDDMKQHIYPEFLVNGKKFTPGDSAQLQSIFNNSLKTMNL